MYRVTKDVCKVSITYNKMSQVSWFCGLWNQPKILSSLRMDRIASARDIQERLYWCEKLVVLRAIESDGNYSVMRHSGWTYETDYFDSNGARL